jgi:IS4 transposase
LRWRIEDWHRVLKTGCRIEELGMKKAERLKRAIAINMIVAWRIMLMTLLGREAPDLPPEVLFSDIEIKVLQDYAEKKL